MDKDVERFLTQQKETFSKAAEELWHGTIGEHVERLLSSSQTLSLEALCASLLETKDNNALHALVRLRAEKALDKLASITPPHP